MNEEIQEAPQQEQIVEQMQETAQEPVQQVAPIVTPEDPQERNWKEARRALNELRQQNEELRLHLSKMQQPQQQEEQTSPDDWVTEKKLQNKIQELEHKIKAKDAETVVDRLKGKYSDFDDVVSEENINYLRENDPELAISLQALASDPYAQGLAAYKMLKKTDYYLNREVMKEKKIIEANAAKPPSVNQVRKSGALAEANRFSAGLTPELKKSLLAEMAEARKNA